MNQKFSRPRLAKYILSSSKTEAELAREVAAYLITQGKTSELDSLMRDVAELRAQQKGIVELTAKSAFPLDEATKSEIESVAMRQYSGAKKVIIHEVTDQSTIGGVRIEMIGANLDLTIRTKLNKLRTATT